MIKKVRVEGNSLLTNKLLPAKKEWLTPVLIEEKIEDETMFRTGAGNDGPCGSYGTICT